MSSPAGLLPGMRCTQWECSGSFLGLPAASTCMTGQGQDGGALAQSVVFERELSDGLFIQLQERRRSVFSCRSQRRFASVCPLVFSPGAGCAGAGMRGRKCSSIRSL